MGKVAIAGRPMAMNQSCFALVGRAIPQSVVYQAIKKAVAALKLKANGATFAAINTRDLGSEALILPTLEDMKRYDSFAKPIWAYILANTYECSRLGEARDTLLPKLMSGEIDVSRIDLKQLNGHLSVLLLAFRIRAPAFSEASFGTARRESRCAESRRHRHLRTR